MQLHQYCICPSLVTESNLTKLKNQISLTSFSFYNIAKFHLGYY